MTEWEVQRLLGRGWSPHHSPNVVESDSLTDHLSALKSLEKSTLNTTWIVRVEADGRVPGHLPVSSFLLYLIVSEKFL